MGIVHEISQSRNEKEIRNEENNKSENKIATRVELIFMCVRL